MTASLIDGVLAAAVGDTLELLLGGSSFPTQLSKTLTLSDITAQQVTFTISTGQLGSDGTKTITSKRTALVGGGVLESSSLTLTLVGGCTLNVGISTSINPSIIAKSQIFDSIQPTLSFAQIENFATNNEDGDLD